MQNNLNNRDFDILYENNSMIKFYKKYTPAEYLNMALIQISDPDSSPSIKKQFSVGIDLGTSNSLIAESINKKVTFFKMINLS